VVGKGNESGGKAEDSHCSLIMKRKGLTIIELMVALAIGTVLILIVGLIHTTTLNFWSRGNDRVFLQEESSFIFTYLEKPIREASGASVENGGKSLILTKEILEGNPGWVKRFYREGNSLKYKVDEEESKVLISGRLQSIAFTLPAKDTSGEDIPGGVGIEMVLQKGKEEFSFQKTVVMRNLGLS